MLEGGRFKRPSRATSCAQTFRRSEVPKFRFTEIQALRPKTPEPKPETSELKPETPELTPETPKAEAPRPQSSSPRLQS